MSNLCPECREELPDNASFCPNCGAEVGSSNGRQSDSLAPDVLQRGIELARSGRKDEARLIAEKMLDENGTNADAWKLRALAALDPSEAVVFLRRAVKYRPDDEWATRNLEKALARAKSRSSGSKSGQSPDWLSIIPKRLFAEYDALKFEILAELQLVDDVTAREWSSPSDYRLALQSSLSHLIQYQKELRQCKREFKTYGDEFKTLRDAPRGFPRALRELGRDFLSRAEHVMLLIDRHLVTLDNIKLDIREIMADLPSESAHAMDIVECPYCGTGNSSEAMRCVACGGDLT